MVRDIRPADCAKVDRVVFLQLLEAVGWHVRASREIALAAPVKRREVELKAATGLGEFGKHLNGGFGNVYANAIAWDARNAMDPSNFASVRRHFVGQLGVESQTRTLGIVGLVLAASGSRSPEPVVPLFETLGVAPPRANLHST